MKKLRIKYNLYIVLVLAICLAPFVCMTFAKTTETAEKKTLAAFPDFLDADGKITLDYLPKMGAYFEDHFAFKEALVSVNAYIHDALFNVSSEDSVILGKDGWLYYSATEDDFCHNNGVSERKLYSMARNVKLMQDYCESNGAKFVFTIAPNKNSLYPDGMPDRYKYKVAELSDAQRLKPYLEKEGVNYLDLFELFSKQDEILYLKQDSHWNNKGARLVYNMILTEVDYEHDPYDCEPIERRDVGDLAGMVYSVGAESEENPGYADETAYEMIAGETVEDMVVDTYNSDGAGKLLMYRDSFGNSLIPYFAGGFEQARFSKVVPYPLSDVSDTEADVVVVEKVERHLPTLAEVPPTMAAKDCSNLYEEDGENFDGVALSEEDYDISLTDDGTYCAIEGDVFGEKLDVCARIFVKISEEDDSGNIYNEKMYEAFLTDSPKGSKMNDQGFAVYALSEDVPDEAIVEVYIK